MDDAREELTGQLAAGKVTVIVGAGVSIQASGLAPCASWKGLLGHGAREAAAIDPDFRDRRLQLVAAEIDSGHPDDLISAAQKISRVLGAPAGGDYRRWLRQTVGALPLRDRSVLDALRGLGAELATTNYDGLLTQVMPERRPVSWRQSHEVERVLRGDAPGILHLHGYWEEVESVILGSRSYEEMIGNEHAQAVLRALRLHRTLVFVGCGAGLEDPNFEQFRDWIARVMGGSEYVSYRLALDGEADALQRLHRDAGDRVRVVAYGERHADLAGYLQSLRGAPRATEEPARDPDDLDAYLAWLRKVHGLLELRGLRDLPHTPQVPLDSVYVALRGDRTTAYERMQARELLEAEVKELMSQLAGQLGEDEQREQAELRRRRFLCEHPLMPSLQQRDRPLQPHLQLPAEVVTLADAFRNERWLVILGDPGSGKTTLARWLTLQLARSRPGGANPTVPAGQVDVEAADPSARVDLGPARVPVLIRVADFVKHRQQASELLVDYLGLHPWLGEHPTSHGKRIPPERLNALLRDHLARGELVVILDGLDEIASTRDRIAAVRAIEEFIRDWVPPSGRPRELPAPAGAIPTPPAATGGNQIVITSRIAGYHAAHVHGDLTHVTIEPMNQPAVERFCDAWTSAVSRLLARGTGEAAAADAEAQSARLKSAIFDPRRPRIRELATNPLLVTIMAMVHRSRESLPQRRAELYQQAMEILIEDWRETGLTTEEVVFVLSPLAAHIHEHYATGLIEDATLRGIVTRRLAEARGMDPQRVPVGFGRDVEAFMRKVREDVGLLAARGQLIYGFLHLTFQEYLAALHLVQDPAHAADQILSRLGDPRWREPIALALGHVGSSWSPTEQARLLHALLDAHDPAGLFPTIPLLLVAALDEMPGVSHDLARRLARSLLRTTGELARAARFDKLRTRVQRALERLWTLAHGALEAELCDAIRNPPATAPETRFAAAALVQTQAWYSAQIVAALIEAQRFDSETWDFPIHQAVRTLLAARDFLPSYQAPRSNAEQLAQLMMIDPREHHKLQRRLRIAQAAHRSRVARIDRLRAARELELPADALAMRRALCSDAELVGWLRQRPGWLRVIVALHGGYFDHHTAERFRERREINRFVKQRDAARTKQIDSDEDFFAGGPWGGDVDNIVYEMAVYGGTEQAASTPPVFDPAAIDRDCELTTTLLSALRRRTPEAQLGQLLESVWSGGGADAARADAFVARLALGDDVHRAPPPGQPELAHRIHRGQRLAWQAVLDPAVRALSAQEALAVELAHPLVSGSNIRTRPVWSRVLDELAAPASAFRWNELFRALTRLHVEITGEPMYDAPLFELPSTAVKAEILGIHFTPYHALDLDQSARSAVDHLVRQPTETFVELLHALCTATSFTSQPGRAHRAIPRLRSTMQLSIEIVDLVSQLQLGLASSQHAGRLISFLGYLVFADGPGRALVPEVLALNLRNPVNPAEIRAQLGAEAGWLPGEVAHIRALAHRVDHPLHRSRALLRLAHNAPESRRALRDEAWMAANEIADPHDRCRILEGLVPLSSGPERASLVGEARAAACAIEDADDRARALARLGALGTGEQRLDLFTAALAAAALIATPADRAETLAAIRETVRSEPRAMIRFEAEVERLGDRALQWHAAGAVGRVVLANEVALGLRTPAHGPEFWQPVILAGLLRDRLDRTGREDAIGGLWRALRIEPGEAQVTDLCERGMAGGLALTSDAIEAVEALVERGHEALALRLLPLLQEPDDAAGLAARWLEHGCAALRDHAALYLAESDRKPTAAAVRGLVALRASSDDRARARVALLLWGADHEIRRESRRFRTSALEPAVLLVLYERIAEARSSAASPRPALGGFSLDLLHDDPAVIEAALADIAAGNERAAAALVLLAEIFEATPEVWSRLKAAYTAGPAPVRRAIALSFAAMSHTGNTQSYSEDLGEFLKAAPSEGLEGLRFIAAGPLAVAEAAREALETQPGGTAFELVEAAETALNRRVQSLPALFESPAAAIAAELSKFAEIALGYSYDGRFFQHSAEATALFYADRPRMLELLMFWARRASRDLQISGQLQYLEVKCWLLFTALELYADRLPAAFANLAAEHRFEDCLAEVARTGRLSSREAMVMLALLRRGSTRTIDALQASLLRGNWVERHALDALERLRQVDPGLVEALIARLSHDSALVAASSAQALAILAHGHQVDAELRRRIVDALTQAIRDPRSVRGIYSEIPRGTLRDLFVARLDDQLFAALGSILGAVDR